jgi:hypothetical protein
MKKAIFFLLLLITLVLLGILIYALVYAPHDSLFWKDGFALGIFNIVAGRFTIMAYRRWKKSQPVEKSVNR